MDMVPRASNVDGPVLVRVLVEPQDSIKASKGPDGPLNATAGLLGAQGTN